MSKIRSHIREAPLEKIVPPLPEHAKTPMRSSERFLLRESDNTWQRHRLDKTCHHCLKEYRDINARPRAIGPLENTYWGQYHSKVI